jgi:hypothetical protein
MKLDMNGKIKLITRTWELRSGQYSYGYKNRYGTVQYDSVANGC